MIDPDLPDELQSDQEYNDATEQRDEMLAAIGQAIAKKRDEAVAARKENGIEQIWIQAEEAYLCIDDMNRAEFAKAKWAKPMAMQAPVIAEVSKGSGDGRSNVNGALAVASRRGSQIEGQRRLQAVDAGGEGGQAGFGRGARRL